MKLVTAKQHGAWAMLFIPFLLSMIIGQARWEHSLLLIAWLGLYLSSYPLLMVIKGKNKSFYLKWFYRYSIPTMLVLLYPIIVEPRLLYFGLAMLPAFAVNLYFAKQKNERALLNDCVAIVNFAIGGLASYFFGAGQLDQTAWLLFSYNIIFFVGTTFYVKTMIREKQSQFYKYLSWSYHIVVIIAFVYVKQYIIALAYVSSAIRAIVLYGKRLPIMKIGIIEIINALIYFVVVLIAFA